MRLTITVEQPRGWVVADIVEQASGPDARKSPASDWKREWVVLVPDFGEADYAWVGGQVPAEIWIRELLHEWPQGGGYVLVNSRNHLVEDRGQVIESIRHSNDRRVL